MWVTASWTCASSDLTAWTASCSELAMRFESMSFCQSELKSLEESMALTIDVVPIS